MSSLAQVAIHSSQFPDQVRRDLITSLRTRQVNHKFLYDGWRQTQKWLALHQACAPSRTDPDCMAIYDRSFEAVARRMDWRRVHLLGLGCGGGEKETRLLQRLHRQGLGLLYTPVDVSAAMVLVARQTVLEAIPKLRCLPLVCDLGTVADLRTVLENRDLPNAAWLVTCFGLLPNFDPQQILPLLAGVLRPGDLLLLSANLAPGPDYAAGVDCLLPLYDNEPTRDWLLAWLKDVGITAADGDLRFTVEDCPSGLKRILAAFHFSRRCQFQVSMESFSFAAGDSIRVFFSYRHTPALVRQLIAPHGLAVVEQWVTASQEEGVFLVSHGSQTPRPS